MEEEDEEEERARSGERGEPVLLDSAADRVPLSASLFFFFLAPHPGLEFEEGRGK